MAQAISATTPAKLEDTGTALLEVDGRHVGELVSIPESKLVGDQWTGVQFARADLLRTARKLLDAGEIFVSGGGGAEGQAYEIPLCKLNALGQIGPDQRRLVDGFQRTRSVTAYPMVQGHDSDQRRSIATSPDTYLAPLTEPRGGQRPGYGDRLWQSAAQLLVAERLRLNTARVTAMCVATPVLSNVWWPIKIANRRYEKALAVWLNGSLGLLTFLATRNTTEGSWVKFKKADLKELPVLDIRQLSRTQQQNLSHLFDEMTDAEFQRLPAMHHCPARQHLDESLAKILNLPTLTTLRHLLATEPTISNHSL